MGRANRKLSRREAVTLIRMAGLSMAVHPRGIYHQIAPPLDQTSFAAMICFVGVEAVLEPGPFDSFPLQFQYERAHTTTTKAIEDAQRTSLGVPTSNHQLCL